MNEQTRTMPIPSPQAGEIPASIAQLGNLKILDLTFNKHGGEFQRARLSVSWLEMLRELLVGLGHVSRPDQKKKSA